MNIENFIKQIVLKFKISTQEAWWIVETLTKKSQAQLISEQNIILTDSQKKQLDEWEHEYTFLHKPIQYILGKVNFCGLEIFVEPPVLIPRNETEYWCDWLVKELSKLSNKKLNILDMCSGSGCIGLTLAKNFPESTVWSVDISNKAIELIKKNSKYNDIKNLIVLHSDLFNNITNVMFDLIVSNPPYIDQIFYKNLDRSVKDWEDIGALMAQDSGLEIIKKIITQSPKFLKINKEFRKKQIPQFVMEFDINQSKIVENLLKDSNFVNIKIHKDLTYRDRFISAGI